MQKIVIVRHGERLDNVDPLFYKKNNQKHLKLNPPLTQEGILMAEQTGESLVEQLKETPIKAIYCSPYLRCLQTAKPLSELTGLPIKIENGLLEWGLDPWTGPNDFQFLSGKELDTEIERRYKWKTNNNSEKARLIFDDDYEMCFKKVYYNEDYPKLYRRMRAFWDAFQDKEINKSQVLQEKGAIVLVSHYGSAECLYENMKGKPEESVYSGIQDIPYCGVAVFQRESENTKWKKVHKFKKLWNLD
ncbi:hypothetical protein M0812_17015 [Anaeramoeba flamelloides]|uniref:Phosphoglycerate mutase n=1 Tax=Anaeramoeba flamelloides TaxID=1746091 RepID=A0AAV7ZDL7_9EUKA|nr:hypothetical protein M0812_17015 [Anaeramoeba flamelloides]